MIFGSSSVEKQSNLVVARKVTNMYFFVLMRTKFAFVRLINGISSIWGWIQWKKESQAIISASLGNEDTKVTVSASWTQNSF